jgi:hypothetical protein
VLTPEQATTLATLDDATRGVACSCGCVHLLAEDVLQRPEVRFRCLHTEHKLEGFLRTYGAHTGVVLDGADVDTAYIAPILSTRGA